MNMNNVCVLHFIIFVQFAQSHAAYNRNQFISICFIKFCALRTAKRKYIEQFLLSFDSYK